MRLTSYLYVCLDKHPHINQDCLCMRDYYILLAMKLSHTYTKTDGMLYISALKNMWNDVNTISPIAQG